MAAKALSSACPCEQASFPGTLHDLHNAEYLDCDLEALALIGTQLSDAVISTNNGAALLTGKGGYGGYQTTAMAHRLSRRRMTLRIAPQTRATFAREAKRANGRQSLVVADPQGVISHRIETADPYDQAVINAFDTCAKTALQLETLTPQNVVSLAAVRNARTHWHGSDSGQHLNDILHDGGITRRAVLPHVGTNMARRVLDQVLVSFLSHLHNRAISYAQLVPGHGFVQMAACVAGPTQLAQKILISQCDNSVFALDLDQIDSLWVTQFGAVSQLELYSDRGRCIAIIAPDPNRGDDDQNRSAQDWNALLASLPPAALSL